MQCRNRRNSVIGWFLSPHWWQTVQKAGGLPLAGGTRISEQEAKPLGMQDRDWYREERRQQRQAAREASQQKPSEYAPSPQKAPRSVFNLKLILMIAVAVIAVQIWQGFV